jgi:beta-lactamase regulating signal transducer with metallopeptidase domain
MTLYSIIDFLSADIANAIAWTILHSLWQASLIALIMSFLIKRYGSRSSTIRYKIALSALYCVLATAAITFLYYYQADHRLLITNNVVISSLAEPSHSIGNVSNVPLLAGFIAFLNENYSFIANTWLLGALFFALKFIGGFSFLQTLRKQSWLSSDSKLYTIFNRLKVKLNIEKEIGLVESDKVKTPIVMGFLKPLIIVPTGIINQLNYNEVEAILAHELSHVIRNDFINNLIQSLVEILFYFHPAVWWISANIRTERENCCDDMALNICGNAIDYAKTLVKVQEWQVNKVPSLAIPLSRNKHSLMNRINRILNQPQNRSQIREKLAATVLLCFAFFAFAFAPQNTDQLIQEDLSFEETIETNKYEELIKKNSLNDLTSIADSLPNSEQKHASIYVKKTSDKEEVEIEIEDGEVKKMIVDGKEIPKEEYKDYEEEYKSFTDKNGNKYFFLGDDDHIGFFGNGDNNPFQFLHKMKDLNWDSIAPGKDLLFFGDSLNFWSPNQDISKFHFHFDSLNMPFENDQFKELLEQYGDQMKDFSDSFEFEMDGDDFIWKGNPDHLWVFPEDEDSLIHKRFRHFDEEGWEEMAEEFQNNFKFRFDELPNHQNFEFHFPEGIEENEFHFKSKSPADAVVYELWDDGLLIEGKENKIELSGKHLKINGDKQPKNIWKKYKSLYEKEAGHELTKKSKIELKVDGNKPKIKRRTIRI